MTQEEKLAADARPPGGSPSVAGKVFKASLAITVIIVICKGMGGVEKFLLPIIYGKDKADRAQAELYLLMAVLAVMFYDIMRYSVIPALLPALVKLREELGEERAVRLAGLFANTLALVTIPVLLLGALYPDGINSLLFVHREELAGKASEAMQRAANDSYVHELAMARSIFRIMAPAGFFLVLGGVAYCLLQSRKRFAASAMGDLAYKVCSFLPLLAVVGLAKLGGEEGHRWALAHGVYYIAMGVLVGAMGLLGIQLAALWKDRAGYRPILDFKDEAFLGVWRVAAWPLLYAVLFIGARRVLDIYFGGTFNTEFHDKGYFMGLEFSYRIVEAPFRFLVEPLAYALFPFLVAQCAAGDREGFSRTLDGGLRTMTLILLPVSVVLFMLNEQLSRVLLPDNAAMMSVPLMFYGLAVVGFGMELLLTRAVFATGDTRSPALLELGALAVYLGVILGTRHTWLAHGSVGLGFAVSRTAKALAMAVVLSRHSASFNFSAWLPFLLRAVVACAAACGMIYLCAWVLPKVHIIPADVRKGAIVEAVVMGAAAGGTYLATLWLLRVKELRELPAMLKKRKGASAAA